ncbi:unnamed protein product [Didymodactylos carnosus]|uniref:Uncharacterized protein n=1 Tax=Didymodactylos carnosus TaxID=1234261 RepID=A0A815IH56_9BILA|nr:unnamed protein product [Didymodactylos carnosus]CAF4248248.1 unnamed protein product [Didymodactylos carnosus]
MSMESNSVLVSSTSAKHPLSSGDSSPIDNKKLKNEELDQARSTLFDLFQRDPSLLSQIAAMAKTAEDNNQALQVEQVVNVVQNDFALAISKLNERVDVVETKIKSHDSDIEEAQRYSRSFCLRVYGVRLIQNENNITLRDWLYDFFENTLGVQLENNIEYCHRSRSSLNQATSSASTRSPAIVVRFISRFDRHAVVSSLGHLKKQNTGITITKDLTPETLKLFHETRNKLNGEEKKTCHYSKQDESSKHNGPAKVDDDETKENKLQKVGKKSSELLMLEKDLLNYPLEKRNR